MVPDMLESPSKLYRRGL